MLIKNFYDWWYFDRDWLWAFGLNSYVVNEKVLNLDITAKPKSSILKKFLMEFLTHQSN